MKLSDFASEFDPSDLPALVGAPMENASVATQLAARGTSFRVQESLMNLLVNAVYSFYFAKRACPVLDALATRRDGHLAMGVREVRNSLLKGAVIGVATTIDVTSGRTRSLPDALNALEIDLHNRKAQHPDDEIDAALDLLSYIRQQTNANEVRSLKYVRHLRNKWAGHSSLDRTVDGWASADRVVDFRIVEDALARMVNAFQDLSALVPMSKDLMDIEAQASSLNEHPDGGVPIQIKVAWSGANALALAMRYSAQQAADAFIDLLCAEPGRPGSSTDTACRSAPRT